jgi:hypothetical protein
MCIKDEKAEYKGKEIDDDEECQNSNTWLFFIITEI